MALSLNTWPLTHPARSCGEGATRTQLAKVLADAYGIPLDRAEGDVAAYLEALAGQDLLAEEASE